MGDYKLYDTVNKRIVISMNMVFDELSDQQHAITDYQRVVTGHKSVGTVGGVFEREETTIGESVGKFQS